MNIVICGIGKFGKELTEHLAKENHNIIIIDNQARIIEEVVNQCDVMGYCGNGASYVTQKEAGVGKTTDLLIATCSTDEINFLCCLVAKKLGVKQTIARIRNPEYALQAQLLGNELGISMTLNPDLDTAREIYRILSFPSALKVETFANGKVDLVETKIDSNSPFANKSLYEFRNKYSLNILVCAVKRNNEVFIPDGSFVLKEGDYVYVTADTKEMENAFRKLKIYKAQDKSTMIIGGGKITYYLTQLLSYSGFSVKIIDRKPEACEALVAAYPKAIVLNGDGTNQKLLLEEGLENTGSLVSLTGMDETNIVVSSFAKNSQVPNVITKVNNTHYDSILSNIGLDSVISPKDIFCSHIIRYVRGMENTRGSQFKTLYRLVGNKVEALEFVVPQATEYTSIPLKDLPMKHNYLLACIIRNNKVIIPGGKDTIEPLDTVIIITTNSFVKDVADILE